MLSLPETEQNMKTSELYYLAFTGKEKTKQYEEIFGKWSDRDSGLSFFHVKQFMKDLSCLIWWLQPYTLALRETWNLNAHDSDLEFL